MSTTATLGKTQAYIDTQVGTATGWRAQKKAIKGGPFITVSREGGAGGSSFAGRLIQELNARVLPGETVWTLYDGNIVEKFLGDANLPSQLRRFLPEDRIPAIMASIGEVVGLHPDLWTLVSRTNETIRRLAELGHAVIVGRGGNFATEGLLNGINIRLVGSPTGRAKRLASAHNCSLEEAAAKIHRLDAARRDYVRSAFGREVAETSAYDLIINTDTFTIAECVDAVMALLRRKELVRDGP